jgi:hypothetical protein
MKISHGLKKGEWKHKQKYVKPKQKIKFFFQKSKSVNHKQKTVFVWVSTKMKVFS